MYENDFITDNLIIDCPPKFITNAPKKQTCPLLFLLNNFVKNNRTKLIILTY